MHSAKRFLWVVVVLVFALAIFAFVLENQQSVALSFLGWSAAELPVSVVVTLALVIGMIVGPALGWLLGRKNPNPKR